MSIGGSYMLPTRLLPRLLPYPLVLEPIEYWLLNSGIHSRAHAVAISLVLTCISCLCSWLTSILVCCCFRSSIMHNKINVTQFAMHLTYQFINFKFSVCQYFIYEMQFRTIVFIIVHIKSTVNAYIHLLLEYMKLTVL